MLSREETDEREQKGGKQRMEQVIGEDVKTKGHINSTAVKSASTSCTHTKLVMKNNIPENVFAIKRFDHLDNFWASNRN